jgi:DNA-binding MarR family transcriptional regulator
VTASTTQPRPSLRAEHIRAAAASLAALPDPDHVDGAIDALAEAVVDSCLATDGAAIEAAATAVRVAAGDLEDRGADGERAEEVEWAEQRGRLYGLSDVLRWQLRARNDAATAVAVEPGSHAHRMLSLLVTSMGESSERLNSGQLAKRLRVDKTQVSRTGRELIERGLATTTSLGRKTYWDITPRGRYALEHLGTIDPDRPIAQGELPLAVAIDAGEAERGLALAAELAAEYDDLTAYVVSPRAWNGRTGTRSKHGLIMLLDAPRGKRGRLAEVRRRMAEHLRPAELTVSAGADGRTFTVIGREAGGPAPRTGARVVR